MEVESIYIINNEKDKIEDKIENKIENEIKNIMKDKIKISGSIGMVFLKNRINKKNIYIYFDDHSNKNYCNSPDSIYLDDLFNDITKIHNDHIILLEEPFISNYSNIKFLWANTPHVIKFRNFYRKISKKCSDKKECYIFPFDIRLNICDVSMDDLIHNINDDEYFKKYDISVILYFRYILYLFDYIAYNEKIFKDTDNNIIFIKKVFDTHLDSEYYKKLKEQFDYFYNHFIEPNKKIKICEFLKNNKHGSYNFLSGYPFINDDKHNFLDQYDKLINGIMEFYAFILLNGFKAKNISIYAGYYHSNNLTHILCNYLNYEQVYQIGNTENIEHKQDNKIMNCLHIEKKIFHS